jgi:hypothetical protein
LEINSNCNFSISPPSYHKPFCTTKRHSGHDKYREL